MKLGKIMYYIVVSLPKSWYFWINFVQKKQQINSIILQGIIDSNTAFCEQKDLEPVHVAVTFVFTLSPRYYDIKYKRSVVGWILKHTQKNKVAFAVIFVPLTVANNKFKGSTYLKTYWVLCFNFDKAWS